MSQIQLQLEPFADPGLSAERLLARLAILRDCIAPAMARRMNYYRNPAVPLATFLPNARSLTLNARLYRQYQEVGLPTRITGFRHTPDGLPVPIGALDIQRKEVVIENDIGWRVNTMVDFAVGQMPVIHSTSPDPAKRRRATLLLQSIFDANGGAMLLTQLMLLGVIHGISYMTIRADGELLARLGAPATSGAVGAGADTETEIERCETSGTPGEAGSGIASIEQPPAGVAPVDDTAWARCVRLATVEAPRVLPVPAKESCGGLPELTYAAILQPVIQPAAGGANVAISTLRRIAGWLTGTLSPQLSMQTPRSFDLWGPKHWQRYCEGHLADQSANPMGFVPVVPFVHQPVPPAGSDYDWLEGTSEIDTLIPLQDELNTRLSDRANRVTMQSFRMYLARGVDNFVSRPIGPGQMWQTDNPDAAIDTFGGDAASPSEDNHIRELREAMDKNSAVPPVAAGLVQNKVGHLTSAVALRVTLSALLARSEKRRRAAEQTLGVVCRRVLELLDAAGVLKTSPADREIEVNWAGALPESISDRLDEAQRKLAVGIPRSVVLAELGYSELNEAKTPV